MQGKILPTASGIRCHITRALLPSLSFRMSALLQKALSSGWLSSGDKIGHSCVRLHTYLPHDLAWSAITEYHRLGGLNHRNFFTVLETASPTSGC